jgi:hypothetical protein
MTPAPTAKRPEKLSEERLAELRAFNRRDMQARAVPLHADNTAALLDHIDALSADLTTAKEAGRRAGLEEAAAFVDCLGFQGVAGMAHVIFRRDCHIATSIRALKEKHDADSAG